MNYGSTTQVLRVNLTSGSLEVEELSEDFYRLYPGGKALAGYILLNEMPPHTEPFAPENVSGPGKWVIDWRTGFNCYSLCGLCPFTFNEWLR